MGKVFLIDGHAQIFRMYYAFMRRPMINSKGEDTSILYGFTKMLLELISKEKPSHIAVAFDPPAKTFRHEAYPLYKANRSAAPELVKAALEPLQEILKAFNIPVVMMPGYEADDVIGSMAYQWESDDSQIFMVTPDKDYGQLISENVYQYKPGKGGNEVELIGKNEICNHYGISNPSQVIDILTIWGDSSDNVPGIRGIGEVGAKKLVAKYGSIDQIINHAGELPQKQQQAIQEAAEQIKMSRFLVTIKKDISLPVELDDIRIKPVDNKGINEVFNRFEFNSLKKLIPNSILPSSDLDSLFAATSGNLVASSGNLATSSGNLVASSGNFAATSDSLVQEESVEIPKVEELSLNEFIGKAKQNSKISVLPIDDSKDIFVGTSNFYTIINSSNIKDADALFADSEISKSGYNFKRLYKVLWGEQMNLSGRIFDIELMHYLINSEMSHKEDMLLKAYLKVDLQALSFSDDNACANNAEPDLFSAAVNEVVDSKEYKLKNATRCCLLQMLNDKVYEDLEKSQMHNLYFKIEAPLIRVLASMEYVGVKIDTLHLNNYSKQLNAQLVKIEAQARELANSDSINLSSPKQVGILLYEKLNLNPKVKKSSKGSYPTDEETLNEMLDSHPIVAKILEYRAIKKLISTYTDALPALINKKTGKIHTTFNQSLTATGRLSSTNPNLQNIPIRTERGREIRKAIIPSTKDGFIVSADYSQIELRLMAHMSEDPNLIDAFNRNMDIHTATAAKVFKVNESDVTKEQRSRAKVANFGIIYGISAFGLSVRLGMSRTDSKELIEEYFKNYPMVKQYMNNMIELARKEGFVKTIYGRKRFLPDINSRNATVRSFSERNAINAPLQGSAADIIKVAMINVYNKLREEGLKSRMVLQVHDELVLDVVKEEVDIVCNIVKQQMEDVIKLHVPLVAECDRGYNWLEAH